MKEKIKTFTNYLQKVLGDKNRGSITKTTKLARTKKDAPCRSDTKYKN